MAHTKIVSPDGWDFGQPTTALLKLSSRGLVGFDRTQFIKRAGHAFLPFLDAVKFAQDEEPVHSIALGALEFWGLNRNGDGFKEAHCIKCCPTFEKHARCYRNHANRDPAQSYGRIVKAAYNHDMHRVELLLAYNRTKAAAERNGGLVADKELEKLASGASLGGSMACRIEHDVCLHCGHQARTRADYCTPEMCKAGGCRDNLTKLVKVGNDYVQVGVDNPNPVWFDWSYVWKPAERTAYGDKATWLKAASFEECCALGGAKLAEELGVTAPWDVALEATMQHLPTGPLTEQIKLAHGLVQLEKVGSLPVDFNRAFDSRLRPGIRVDVLHGEGWYKLAEGLRALADEQIVLPISEFARLIKKAELGEIVDNASARLPGVHQRMLADGTLETRLQQNPYRPSAKQASLKQRQHAREMAPAYSLRRSEVEHRCQLSALRSYEGHQYTTTKQASAAYEREAEELARDYACYQIAALQHMADSDPAFTLTAELAMLQIR